MLGVLDDLDLRRCVFLGKVAAERADAAGRTAVFAGTFGLGFIGEDHFANGVTAGDRGIEDGHDLLPFFTFESLFDFSLVRFLKTS